MAILKDTLDVRNLNKYNILYVDDEEINLKVFKETFKRDYNVFTASTGREALQLIDDHKDIDLVITDQRMPEMTGTELLEKVVVKNPQMLRMIMTGHSDLEVIVKAVNEYGIDQYITKPWNADNLKETLDALLASYSKELLKAETKKASADEKESKIVSYSNTLLNLKSYRVDLIRKYFSLPLVINYSRDCEGKENLYVYEFPGDKGVMFLMINCSVPELPGSLVKAFITGYAKDQLLENEEFSLAKYYENLVGLSKEITKKHFYDNLNIGLTIFYSEVGKDSDIVITNTHMLYGYKNGEPINPETMVGHIPGITSDNSKVYEINKSNCDKLYVYAIDTLIDKDIFEGNLLIKLEEGQEMSYGEQIISLQAFLNSSISDSGVDKFSLIGLDYSEE